MFVSATQGHTAYLIGNFAEWVLAFAFNCYFYSMAADFKDFTTCLTVREVDADDADAPVGIAHAHKDDGRVRNQRQSAASQQEVNERTHLLTSSQASGHVHV